MPNINVENISKTKVKLTITVSKDEMKPFLEKAAQELSKDVKIPGFRPGKATYEQVEKRVGAMAILEAAMDDIVRKFYVQTAIEKKLDAVGPPNINVTKMAPDNDLEFEATVSTMPAVTKLADWKTLEVKQQTKEVTDKEVNQALDDLTNMQTKEVRAAADETVGDNDKVVVDLFMTRENVPIEGGKTQNSIIMMNQESYLPGLKEELKGTKEGEEKTFTISIPKDHSIKNLAGDDVTVKATVKEIFHLLRPEVDEELAKGLGMKSVDELKEKIRENLNDENKKEETQRQERATLAEIAKNTDFDEIPDLLIEEELNKMLHELRSNVNNYGLEFEQYLVSIKKTVEDLQSEMRPQAQERIEAALVLREIAKQENIEVEKEKVDEVIAKTSADVTDQQTIDRILSPEFRAYQENIMRNRKVIDLLISTMIK